ncbi:N-acetyltransferase, partial [Burkholderia multivorans]
TADLGQLAHINLAPEAFGTGVAAVLFTALEDELRHDGYARAYLMVAEGNDRAMRFYEKQGWARTEITHVYDGVEPAVPERMYT